MEKLKFHKRHLLLLWKLNKERWPSGWRRTLGKRVCGWPYRGFESHPFRHHNKLLIYLFHERLLFCLFFEKELTDFFFLNFDIGDDFEFEALSLKDLFFLLFLNLKLLFLIIFFFLKNDVEVSLSFSSLFSLNFFFFLRIFDLSFWKSVLFFWFENLSDREELSENNRLDFE